MLFGAVIRRLQAGWPQLTGGQSFAIICALGCLVVLVEPLFFIPFHLWDYPGAPWSIAIGSYGKYPVFPEILAFGLWIAFPVAVRCLRDDRGRTFVERAMDHYDPRVRKAVTLLALYTIFQFA